MSGQVPRSRHAALAGVLLALLAAAWGPGLQAHGMATVLGWPTYAEVTEAAGLGSFVHGGFLGDPQNGTSPSFLEIVGPGACWLDADGDARLDLYLVSGIHLRFPERNQQQDPRSRLFLQRAGGFVDAGPWGDAVLRGLHYGCAAADYDDDGDDDLYVTGWGGSVLLRNDGGAFANVTAAAGVRNSDCEAFPCWAASASWWDYDKDGCLDLFVNNWGDFDEDNPPPANGPEHIDPQKNRLYHARCDGTFEDRADAAGLTHLRHSWSSVAVDLNDDGWTDLYVSNDGDPNDIYRNLHNGTFAHQDSDERHGMGTATGDFDHNGRPDVVSTNYVGEQNAILRNQNTTFVDIGSQAPFTDAYDWSGWAAHWFDLQNDGHLDLMVLNGMTEATGIIPLKEPVLVYENLHGGPDGSSFRVVRDDLGASLAADYVARGGAWADYDDDGDIDVLIAEAGENPTHLLRAEGTGGNFLNLDLVGTAPNVTRDAIGASVRVRASGLATQRLDRVAGSGHLSSNDPRLHVGLARAEQADLEVRWPDGSIQSMAGVRANSFLRIVQGQAEPEVLRELALVRIAAPEEAERAVPLTLRAEALAGGGASIASLAWDLGDGTLASGAEVTHTFLEEGPFTVRVSATDTLGRRKVEAHRILIEDILTAELTMAKAWYLPVEAAEGTVRVTYRDGSPLAGASVSLRVEYSSGLPELDALMAHAAPTVRVALGYRTLWVNGTTDAQGQFAFGVHSLFVTNPGVPELPELPGLGSYPGVYTLTANGGTRWSLFEEQRATYSVGPRLPP